MKNAMTAYLKFVYQSRSPKTHITYKMALEEFLFVTGGAELTKETYIDFLKKTSGMNPSTQALYRSAIKGLYLFAADTDPGIDTSFFRMADKRYALKPARRLILFNKDGIEQIIKHADTMRNKPEDLRDRAFIFLLADSGLRISEACNIRIGDVDLLEQRAVIIGKGNKQAVINLSNRTIGAIRDYLVSRNLHIKHDGLKSSPLFIRHDKRVGDLVKPVKPDGMWHAIKRRAIEAGVDPKTVRVHDFRHYFVTVVYHAKGIRLAQKLARHERIETTSRYTHLVEDEGEAYNEIFNK
jgi:integrase/recombinase XerC